MVKLEEIIEAEVTYCVDQYFDNDGKGPIKKEVILDFLERAFAALRVIESYK